MSEHTPESWVVYETKKYGIQMIFPAETVVEIDEDRGDYPRHIADDVRGEANARLIAAAPKLLAACEAAMEWAAGFPLGIASTQADRQAADDVYRRCEAAIAKARGE